MEIEVYYITNLLIICLQCFIKLKIEHYAPASGELKATAPTPIE